VLWKPQRENVFFRSRAYAPRLSRQEVRVETTSQHLIRHSSSQVSSHPAKVATPFPHLPHTRNNSFVGRASLRWDGPPFDLSTLLKNVDLDVQHRLGCSSSIEYDHEQAMLTRGSCHGISTLISSSLAHPLSVDHAGQSQLAREFDISAYTKNWSLEVIS